MNALKPRLAGLLPWLAFAAASLAVVLVLDDLGHTLLAAEAAGAKAARSAYDLVAGKTAATLYGVSLGATLIFPLYRIRGRAAAATVPLSALSLLWLCTHIPHGTAYQADALLPAMTHLPRLRALLIGFSLAAAFVAVYPGPARGIWALLPERLRDTTSETAVACAGTFAASFALAVGPIYADFNAAGQVGECVATIAFATVASLFGALIFGLVLPDLAQKRPEAPAKTAAAAETAK